jgi:hypothetical protein
VTEQPRVTYFTFVATFPEFKDPSTYLQATIDEWIHLAYEQLDPHRFGRVMHLAVKLWVAHQVTLSAREVRAANAGQIVGEVRGPVTGKSVGKASISYSTETSIDGAGYWNSTTYGQRFFAMMRSFGGGPFYVRGRGRSFGPGFRPPFGVLGGR